MSFFLFALDVAGQAQAQVAGFNFWDAALQKAVIYCLTGLGGLFVAYGLYWGARTWKLRNLTAPQRRKDDDRYKELKEELERRTDSMEQQLRDRVAKVETKLDTVEGLQRNTLEDFKDLEKYVHKHNHDLRDSINLTLGKLEGRLDQLAENTSEGFSIVTRRIDEALGAFLRHVTQG